MLGDRCWQFCEGSIFLKLLVLCHTLIMTRARLYWIGLYEEVELARWGWFLHVDWAPAIGFGSKRFLGGGEYRIQRSGAP